MYHVPPLPPGAEAPVATESSGYSDKQLRECGIGRQRSAFENDATFPFH
jgi:hypothetical protein